MSRLSPSIICSPFPLFYSCLFGESQPSLSHSIVKPKLPYVSITNSIFRDSRQGLGERLKPPCAKCVREGAECVLAGSRRGGDFSHFRRSKRASSKKSQSTAARPTPPTGYGSPRQHKNGDGSVHDNLQNPSDALLILANAAGENSEPLGLNSTPGSRGDILSPTDGVRTQASGPPLPDQPDDVHFSNYPLIQDGTLNPALLLQLLRQ